MYHRVLTAPMAATVMFQYQGPSPCDPSSKGGQRCIMKLLIPIWYMYVNHHIYIQWPFANGDSICTYSSCLKFLSSIYLQMGICIWGFAHGDLHMEICTPKICICGSPCEKLPEKAYFGPFMFAYGVCLHMVISIWNHFLYSLTPMGADMRPFFHRASFSLLITFPNFVRWQYLLARNLALLSSSNRSVSDLHKAHCTNELSRGIVVRLKFSQTISNQNML